jgi:hypothetical protein
MQILKVRLIPFRLQTFVMVHDQICNYIHVI